MDGVKILFFFVFTKLNCRRLKVKTQLYTGCPTTYQTRHFFNNSKTNEDNATRFEQEYVRCVRNEEECVCSVCLFRCNIFIGFRIINPLNAELNPICCFLALLGAHHFLYVSRIKVKSLTLRLLMSYIYIYIYMTLVA